MKPNQLLVAILVLLFPFCSVFSQDKVGGFEFFAKKRNSYALEETGYYGRMTNYDNGQKVGHSNRTYADVNWNYWLGGGLGIGLEAYGNWSGSHPTNNNDFLNRNWTLTPSVSYGKTLTDRWGVYGRAGITFGIDKDIFKTPSTTTTDKYNLFGYEAGVSFPYRFSKYTALTATIGYDYLSTKQDEQRDRDYTWGLNLRMEDYLSCSQMSCDPGSGFKLSRNRYQQGSGLITFDTRADLSFGKTKSTNSAFPNLSYTTNYNDADISFNGVYYIIDNLALGGGLEFGRSSSKPANTSNENTFTYFDFNPELNFNLPGSGVIKNFFIKGGGYFGSEKSETTVGPQSYTFKYNNTGFNAGVGYNAFFAEQTALRACVYYRSLTTKEKGTDDKQRQSGIGASVGLVHAFGNF